MPRTPDEPNNPGEVTRRAFLKRTPPIQPRTKEERESFSLYLDRSAARLKEQWTGKRRALPFPDLHELDPLNDPIGWQFGLHVGPKEGTEPTE